MEASLKYWYACMPVALVTSACSDESLARYSGTHQYRSISHFCRVFFDVAKKLPTYTEAIMAL